MQPPRLRPALVLIASVAALALSLAACGDDEQIPPEGPQATIGEPAASLGGKRTVISNGSFEKLISSDADVAPGEPALIVGHVGVADDASDLRLRLTINGKPLGGAEDQPISEADPSGSVISCLCKIPGDARSLTLEVAGEGTIDVTGRSLAIVGEVESAAADSASSLQPSLVAAIESKPPRIVPEPTTLVEATASVEGSEPLPLVIVGLVRSANSTTDFAALQVDAVVGDEQLQPVSAYERPGTYGGVYITEVEGPDVSIDLVSATADGSTPLSGALLFACACRLAEGAGNPTPG